MRKLIAHSYVLKGVFIGILGVTLGVGGPYGTFEQLPLALRVGYWMLALFFPWALWESLFAITSKYVPKELNPRMLMTLIMPAFAVIGSAFVSLLGIQVGFLKAGTFL